MRFSHDKKDTFILRAEYQNEEVFDQFELVKEDDKNVLIHMTTVHGKDMLTDVDPLLQARCNDDKMWLLEELHEQLQKRELTYDEFWRETFSSYDIKKYVRPLRRQNW